jgi:hypothetical protein
MKIKCEGCGKEDNMPFIYWLVGKEGWTCDQKCYKKAIKKGNIIEVR